MEILKNAICTSRKEHRCNFCECVIQRGVKYRRQSILNDGTVYDWVSHIECSDLTYKLQMYNHLGYDEGINADDFRDAIRDYLEDTYTNQNMEIPKQYKNKHIYNVVCHILKNL